MFGKDLIKYLYEFQRYVRNYKYEYTKTGIYFPVARAHLQGAYTHWITGYESEMCTDPNVVTIEGQSHFLSVAFKAVTPSTLWYLGLHSGTGAEDEAVDASTYNSTYGEITAQSGDPGGYTASTRVLWDTDAVDEVNSELENDATPAAFTISTTSTCIVNGAWLTNKNGRTDYSGVAMSIAKFTAQRNLADTDVFNLKYKVDLDKV